MIVPPIIGDFIEKVNFKKINKKINVIASTHNLEHIDNPYKVLKKFVDKYDEALAHARQEGKPLFIDFTGVYCANCRVMERRVFPTKSVKEQLDKMVLTRLYVDKKDSLSQVFAQLQFERYKQATQPYYVILDPKDESTMADTGGYVPNGFAEFLKEGLSSYYEKTDK